MPQASCCGCSSSIAWGVAALLLGFRQRLALMPQQLQVAQKPAERALLLAGLLRILRPCHGSLLLVFLPGREAGQGILVASIRFQQGHRIAAALQFLQRLPLGIPELAECQQPFLWCTGRMVSPLELGALANRFLEFERGLVEIGEQTQGPVQVPLQLGGHQALQPFVAHHPAHMHAVFFFNPARPQFDRGAQPSDRR